MTALDDRPAVRRRRDWRNEATTMGDWADHAACRGADTELFFPHSGETTKIREAKAICATCPVWPECRQDGIDGGESRGGIWGGLTETDRRRLRTGGSRGGFQKGHGGVRNGLPKAERARALARYHEIRPQHPSGNAAQLQVAAEFGISAPAVHRWLKLEANRAEAQKPPRGRADAGTLPNTDTAP